jgi:hypothetical protein
MARAEKIRNRKAEKKEDQLINKLEGYAELAKISDRYNTEADKLKNTYTKEISEYNKELISQLGETIKIEGMDANEKITLLKRTFIYEEASKLIPASNDNTDNKAKIAILRNELMVTIAKDLNRSETAIFKDIDSAYIKDINSPTINEIAFAMDKMGDTLKEKNDFRQKVEFLITCIDKYPIESEETDNNIIKKVRILNFIYKSLDAKEGKPVKLTRIRLPSHFVNLYENIQPELVVKNTVLNSDDKLLMKRYLSYNRDMPYINRPYTNDFTNQDGQQDLRLKIKEEGFDLENISNMLYFNRICDVDIDFKITDPNNKLYPIFMGRRKIDNMFKRVLHPLKTYIGNGDMAVNILNKACPVTIGNIEAGIQDAYNDKLIDNDLLLTSSHQRVDKIEVSNIEPKNKATLKITSNFNNYSFVTDKRRSMSTSSAYFQGQWNSNINVDVTSNGDNFSSLERYEFGCRSYGAVEAVPVSLEQINVHYNKKGRTTLKKTPEFMQKPYSAEVVTA